MNLKDIIFSNIRKNSPAFGLDISDFSIKMTQLKKKRRKFNLESFSRISIPEGVIKEGKIEKEKELAGLIKKSLIEAKGELIKNPYAVCSLPEQHSFVKIIQLPRMKMDEAKEAIKWEIEANIPLSLEEVYLDWQIIPSKKPSDRLDILINAAPRKLVDEYLNVLRLADIEPVVFEIESIATARSLIKNELSPKPVLIIDLGYNRTSFIVFAGNSIRFTSSIPISNQQMIAAIAKKLGVSQKEAQALKFKIGLDKDKEKGKIFNALLPSLTELINKIKDYTIFYKEHDQVKSDYQEDVSKIILCGGGAYLKGLPKYLSNRLKIPVSLGNPWINILKPPLNKIPGIPYKESLAYTTALGLALRGTEIKC